MHIDYIDRGIELANLWINFFTWSYKAITIDNTIRQEKEDNSREIIYLSASIASRIR